jgi:arginine-tRNA-protein transferase
MDYKTRFQPQEHLTPRGWERFDPSTAPQNFHD